MSLVTRSRIHNKVPVSLKYANVGVLVFIIGSIISMITYPRYDFMNSYLSELGTKSQSRIWFNYSVMLTALLLIPTIVSVQIQFLTKGYGEVGFELSLGIILGLLAVISLFFVGFFEASGSTILLHNVAALLFFVCFALSMSFFSVAILKMKNKDSHFSSHKNDYIGFVFIPLILLLSNFRAWYHFLLQKLFAYVGIFVFILIMKKLYFLSLTGPIDATTDDPVIRKSEIEYMIFPPLIR